MNNKEIVKCCFCDEEIPEHGIGSNNPWPLVENGRTKDDSNNTPSLQTYEKITQEQRAHPLEDYPEPYTILEFNDVPFSKIVGLSAISGQKKNGKSFVLTQLTAVILGYGTERVQQHLTGLTVPKRIIDYLDHEPRVLYVDTEKE